MGITVGVAAFNEGKGIAKCLLSILPQISQDDEIIVVSSGSTDNTEQEVSRMMDQDSRIRLIVQKERKGKASAINLIVQKARGDIIVQTDADVELDEYAIRKLKYFFELFPKVGAVSGNPIPVIPKNNLFYDWTVMSYRKMDEIRRKEMDEGRFWHISGYLCAFRKEAMKEIPFCKGAVDARMGMIIRDGGWLTAYSPEAKVYVKAPLTIRDFVAQKARVRAGYCLLPKGQGPRTAGSEMRSFPRELFRVPVWRWHKFIISAMVYGYSWMKGWYMAKTNKSLQQIWKTPVSTK